MDIPVRALDCDTITQVKDKALDMVTMMTMMR